MSAKSASNTRTARPGPRAKVQPLPRGVRLGSDGIYYWQVKRKRDDGSEFRKSGKCKSADDALAKFYAAQAEFESGVAAQDQTMTLAQWADYCVQNIMPDAPSRSGRPLSPRTLDSYVHLLGRWHKPHLGDLLLDRVTPEHVEQLLNKVGGEAQSRLNVRNLGSKLYVIAQLRGKVPQGFNPFKIVQVARSRQRRNAQGQRISHTRVLTEAEELALIQAARNSEGYKWFEGCILLGIRCGLRISEVCGLDWKDVDLERGVLHITQQSVTVSAATRKLKRMKVTTHKVITDPKTESGIRSLPLPPSVRQWLAEHKTQADKPWVFADGFNLDRVGRERLNLAMSLSVKRAAFRVRDDHGTPLAKATFHDLRHTFCTRMAVKFRVAPNVLKTLAGHSNIVTTLGYYVETDQADLVEAMANIK